MTSVQRKVGVSFLHGGGPVSWGGERRYTCPSPRVNATREEGHEVRTHFILSFGVSLTNVTNFVYALGDCQV